MKGTIGKSVTAALLVTAFIVGISGPVAAMDRTKMVLMFWGGGSAPPGALVFDNLSEAQFDALTESAFDDLL